MKTRAFLVTGPTEYDKNGCDLRTEAQSFVNYKPHDSGEDGYDLESFSVTAGH